MVKPAYDVPQIIEYPLVTVLEIDNSENDRYSTDEGEQVTNLSYQIETMCETTQLKDGTFLTPSESAKLLGKIVAQLLGGKRYKMKRIATSPLLPLTPDQTVMRYIQRFECCLFNKQNTIYRR